MVYLVLYMVSVNVVCFGIYLIFVDRAIAYKSIDNKNNER